MAVDIDSLSIEISKTLSEDVLVKAVPPKLAYRFRSWMRQNSSRISNNPSYAYQLIHQKFEEMAVQKSLQKNEAVASFYESGVVRLDFGADIPEKIKKAALAWAKKRGLRAVEASIAKSLASPSYIVFSESSGSDAGICLQRYKWKI